VHRLVISAGSGEGAGTSGALVQGRARSVTVLGYVSSPVTIGPAINSRRPARPSRYRSSDAEPSATVRKWRAPGPCPGAPCCHRSLVR